MIKVFIGFDPKETAPYHVLNHSIMVRSSEPVSVTPLALCQLEGVLTRPRHTLQSTDFSFSRFLAPWMCDFEGWSIFMDCDMLVMDDIAKLWALRDDQYSLMCVKHDHVPKGDVKFLNAKQTKYEKKNWSSVMMFNNAKCTALTPEYVNNATGLELHQFKWLENDDLIGEIPAKWNHLADYTQATEDVSLVHYTEGGPYFREYTHCEFAREWFEELQEMQRVDQRPPRELPMPIKKSA